MVDDSSFVAVGAADGWENGCACGIGGAGGAAMGLPDSEVDEAFLKYGFLDSSAGGLDSGVASPTLLVEAGTGGAENDEGGGDRNWLVVGVDSWGVTCCGPSSSSEESSSRFSS